MDLRGLSRCLLAISMFLSPLFFWFFILFYFLFLFFPESRANCRHVVPTQSRMISSGLLSHRESL